MSETSLAVQEHSHEVAGFNWTQDDIERIKNQICSGFDDGDFKTFLYIAKRRRLDPFAKQIYPVKRKGKMVIQTGIDGFRLTAERTGKYRGQTPPMWCGKDGVWKDVWLSDDYPAAAKIGVWVDGNKEPIYAVATWRAYVQMDDKGVGFMWHKMPDVMLIKCAEAQALRKAFPEDLSGLYTDDEMAQSENVVKEYDSQPKNYQPGPQPKLPAQKPQSPHTIETQGTRVDQGGYPQSPPAANGKNPSTGNNLASPKQLNLLRVKMSQARIAQAEMNQYLSQTFGIHTIEELDWKQFKTVLELVMEGRFHQDTQGAYGNQPQVHDEEQARYEASQNARFGDIPPPTDQDLPF